MSISASGGGSGSAAPSTNYRKHTTSNPLQRWLIGRFHRQVLRFVETTSVATAIEVGCGEGFVLRYLRDHTRLTKIVGVDIDPLAVALARQAVPDVPVSVADAYQLPTPGQSFDLVLCLEVLEHLESPRAALEEIRRVGLRHAILSVPNEPFFRMANLLRGKNVRGRRPSDWGDDPGHRQHWSSASFTRFIGQTLTVRAVVSSFPWTIILADMPADMPPAETPPVV